MRSVPAQRLDARRGARAVHDDPALPEIEVWARRYDTLRDDTDRLVRSVRRRSGSIVRQFDRIVGVLTGLGYLTAGDDPRPTADGMLLAALYAETDLVLAEAVRRGVLDDLEPADLAAVASAFVYETRLKEPPPLRFPTAATRAAVADVVALWQDVVAREEAATLPPTRAPDPGFADVVWRWASGADLAVALGATEMTAGDFVRNTKQVADVLRQLRGALAGTAVGDTAATAARALVRGVVAYTGV